MMQKHVIFKSLEANIFHALYKRQYEETRKQENISSKIDVFEHRRRRRSRKKNTMYLLLNDVKR